MSFMSRNSSFSTMILTKTRLKFIKDNISFLNLEKLLSNIFFSSILEMKGNFEMGLKLFKTAGSRPGFFRSGWTLAVLHRSRT